MALPPMLEDLEIEQCPILESLPEGMMRNNTTLQRLVISTSQKLELSLDLGEDHMRRHNHHSSSLTSLQMFGCCFSLISFPLSFFTKLEYLSITDCRNLEFLCIPDGLLTSLRTLCIIYCHNLVSFPQGGLPAPNLRRLAVSSCNKLKSLPQGMHTLLTSLQELKLHSCPEIDSFPDGGFPPNLSKLSILGCNKLMNCPMEWGLLHLRTLPFLRSLKIQGHKEQRFLPSTLTHLAIMDFPNLKCLEDNKGLQHLTSLEISSIPNLKSLDDKEFQHLTSLQTLWIDDCEKLKYLPKQGLPSSLSCLRITRCPFLITRCERNKGKEWPNISHIPCILFAFYSEENEEVIFLS